MSDNKQRYFEAVKSGNLLDVALCLRSGVDINTTDSSGMTGLMVAIGTQNDIAEFLIDQGIDLNLHDVSSETAISYAIYDNNTAIVNKILKTGHDVDTAINEWNTALGLAVTHRIHDMVDLLLAHGANPKLTHSYGISALEIAENDDDFNGLPPDQELIKKLKAHIEK